VTPGEGEEMSNHPKLHPDWGQLRESVKGKPWKSALVTSLKAFLGFWGWGEWANIIGSGLKETEIDARNPIAGFFGFEPLHLLWVQFNTFDQNTRLSGTYWPDGNTNSELKIYSLSFSGVGFQTRPTKIAVGNCLEEICQGSKTVP